MTPSAWLRLINKSSGSRLRPPSTDSMRPIVVSASRDTSSMLNVLSSRTARKALPIGGYLISTVYTKLGQRRAIARAQRAMGDFEQRREAEPPHLALVRAA